MEARIQKWGNSAGIRIPSSVLKSLNIKTNDILNIETSDNKIIISASKRKHKTLEERYNEFKNLQAEEKGYVESFDWGEDLGKEKID